MPGRSSGGRSRSSGGGGKSLFSSPRPAASTTVRNPPPQPAAAAAAAPPPAPIQRGPVTGGIGSTIAEGMAFGGGSAIAHRAVDSLMGPRVVRHETVVSNAPAAAAEPAATVGTNSIGGLEACGNQFKAFQDCLNHYGNEISKCQFYMDMLSECRKTSTTGLQA